jgi:hypothetical protein
MLNKIVLVSRRCLTHYNAMAHKQVGFPFARYATLIAVRRPELAVTFETQCSVERSDRVSNP